MIDKKKLKREYKETVQPMGVYRITNTVDGKIFIGASKNLKAAYNSNMFQLNGGMHRNKELQAAYSHLGEESFSFDVLDYLEPKQDPGYDYSEDLKVLEEMWIDKLQPFDEKGYNRRKPGPV